MRLQVNNEYDRLEAVLVHRPGREIERLTHENMGQFLFEDTPYLRRMQDEHDAFVQVMRDHDIKVVYLDKVLLEVLGDDAPRRRLVRLVCKTAGVPALADDLGDRSRFCDADLVDALIVGLTVGEHRAVMGDRGGPKGADDDFLLPPIPNMYFTRDPAVVVRDTAISSKMHYPQRIRESVLVRAVLENHPEFRDNVITYGGTDEPLEDRPFTIEGGDVIILSPEAVLIGASERTRSETIEKIAGKCCRDGHVRRVYEIPIPTERSFMHLDTVFTVLDRGVVLWYPPVMTALKYIHRYEPTGDTEAPVRRVVEDRSFVDLLRAEFDCDVTVIDTAGGQQHFAKREQRADGTNAFAIAPKLVIAYERNERTIAALEAQGVTCLGIDDSELVRGLGGPRCMTMPLRRAMA